MNFSSIYIDSKCLSIVLMFSVVIGCNNRDLNIPNNLYFQNDKPTIQLVYISSSHCVYCNDDFHREVKKLRLNLKKWALNYDYQLISTGISVDANSEKGISFLRESGPYNEVVSGWTWYNSGVYHHVWNNKETEGFVPQIKLLKLKFHIAGSPFGNILNIDREEEVLSTLSNLKELKNFNTNFNLYSRNWISKKSL